MKIKVCTGKKCKENGSEDLYKDLKKFSKKVNKYIKKEDLDKKKLKVKKTSCQHNCKNAPSVKVKSKTINKADYDKVKKKVLHKYKIPKSAIK